MSVSRETETLAKGLFSSLGDIDVRALKGEHRRNAGLYCDGVLFGIIAPGEVIFLRAEGVVARALAAEGSELFGDGTGAYSGYWRLPEASLEDPAEAALWANRSLELARASWHE